MFPVVWDCWCAGLARENAPAIVFIDEIDSIATKRFDAQTGADREVNTHGPPSREEKKFDVSNVNREG